MRISVLLIFFFVQAACFAQLKSEGKNIQQPIEDSIVADSVSTAIVADSIWRADSVRINAPIPFKAYHVILNELLEKNKLINLKQTPVSLKSNKEKHPGKEYLFYLLSIIILIFGFFKVFYATYFNNIFRVFFNTSLRQNQLTDLLLQAKLPSLIFNIFFIVNSGLYLWLLLHYYNFINAGNNKTALAFCILTVSVIYILKFCVLKFIGWITGMRQPVDTYIFVIFLVNKIIGITLIFFILLLAFASPVWQGSVVIFSYLIIGVLFFLRFMRSYSLLQHHISISRIHFILYIVSIEVLPILILYKLFIKIFMTLS